MDVGGEIGVIDHHGRFCWYELLTTDVAAASAFYGSVIGWEAQDASTAALAYHLFTKATAPVGGLMDLPQEARRMGATPRWIGYVDVDDVDAIADRIKRLGGAVYVPPTDSNIGRVSIVADPQTATLALVTGLKVGAQAPSKPDEPNEAGRVGWHELLAADWKKAFAFYGGIFGWQGTEAEAGATDIYQLFATGGRTIGGIFTKRPLEPVPFWLYYFNVDDIDAAMARVKRSGGRVFEGPFEVPGGSWVVRCVDPQGATFALQGTRSQASIKAAPAAEYGWSTEWGGISSRGRVLFDKTGGKARQSKPRS